MLEDFFYSCEVDSRFSNRELILDVPENFPYLVLIDPEKIVRVLDNLFTNAVKYSKDGDAITLSAKQSKNEVVVSIKDTGIGMEKKELDKIFDRTYRITSYNVCYTKLLRSPFYGP